MGVRSHGVVFASIALVAAIALGGGPARAAEAARSENQCVACHARIPDPIALGHAFDEWRYSAHGREGVGCEKCHGGDATATTAEAAHVGVLRASEPESLVHATKLAATCGACHEMEAKAYEQTVHAKQVAEQGRGATCMTCHGVMAASYPSPAELEARCAACHDRPYEAKAALYMLADAKRGLVRTREEIESLHVGDPEWERNALERLDRLERDYADLPRQWHAFDTPGVLQRTRDLLQLLKPIHAEADKHRELLEREKSEKQ